jgi:hypothetical protein
VYSVIGWSSNTVADGCIRFKIKIGRHLYSVWEHRILEKLEEESGVESIYNDGWGALPDQFLLLRHVTAVARRDFGIFRMNKLRSFSEDVVSET